MGEDLEGARHEARPGRGPQDPAGHVRAGRGRLARFEREARLFTVDERRTESRPLNTSFNEWQGCISPDGRWIAYVSDETGINAVFVAAFPSGRSKKAVSVGGGTSPQWRADGRELFYVSDSYGMMAVPITAAETTLDTGTPIELFHISRPADLKGRNDAILYRADPDGQCFLIATKASAADSPHRFTSS
jgi:eukaryotic-like serine/threonine-protein kinase